jgi:hypothetical protein
LGNIENDEWGGKLFVIKLLLSKDKFPFSNPTFSTEKQKYFKELSSQNLIVFSSLSSESNI